MKRYFLLLLAAPLLTACPYVEPYEGSATSYSPVYMKRSDLEQSVKYAEAPRALRSLGKIYVKGDTIYLGEKYEGVHVINNADPARPVNVAFIIIPGCVDMAVKENILYADNTVDLVCVDLAQRREVFRKRNVFPPLTPPDGGYFIRQDNNAEMVIVRWKLKSK